MNSVELLPGHSAGKRHLVKVEPTGPLLCAPRQLLADHFADRALELACLWR
jgi:hypothetical protein